ncbi:MAG: tetratricopeptide repeat protein [Anaerolineaceae bacterium]|nr:tetratricopeptide repeat protein [Anaerolineaceae bacterium]
MQQLKIHCFGYLKIEKDGEVITQFDTDKARALLVYLAVESQRSVPRSYLAGLFWSDLSEKQALQSLRQTLSILRKVLGDNGSENPIIQSERDHLRLNPAIPVWVDVLEFKRLLNQAYRHFQRQDQFHQINFRSLASTLQLREGDFLEKFSISGAPLFDEWVSIIREDLDHLAVEALILLVQYYQNRGEFGLAKQSIQRILSIAPWSESAHLMMMQLYARDGQWNAFENQFRSLRKFLKEQIGVEPAHETMVFYEETRKNKSKNPLFTQETPQLTNIPHGEAIIIGRELELDEITNLLVDPVCRLITLHGPGGIGKTSLAMEIARQQVGIFQDGVFFISLIGAHSNEEFIAGLIEAITVPMMDSGNLISRLKDFLHNKCLLLVLDNFEHLLIEQEVTQSLSDIMQHASRVKLLVTSRERLNLKDEWVYPLKGMAYPGIHNHFDPTSIDKFGALMLFQQRARQVKPDFQWDAQSIAAVVEICQLFEGLPLGIELAAADVWSQSCQVIAKKINNHWNSLNANASDVSPRYRSLWANLEDSWTLLDDNLQRIFWRIGIFEDSFSIQAAETISHAKLQDLDRLVNQSILQHDLQGRYKMHSVIRQFAREKMYESGDYTEIQTAFVNYFADFLCERQLDLETNQQKQALKTIQVELINLKNAWDWILKTRQIEKVETFLDPMYQFFNIRSRYQEGIDFLQPALNLVDQLQTETPLDQNEITKGKLLVRIGTLAHRVRKNETARDFIEKAAQIFKKYGLDHELANCRTALAGVHLRANDFVKAEENARANLDFYQQFPNVVGQIKALNTIGLVNLRRGNIEEARKFLNQSVDLGRKNENSRPLMVPLNYLGDIACNEGKYSEAKALFEESLQIASELEDLYQMAIVLNNLASVFHVELDYPKASEMYAKSLAICRQIGDMQGESIALANLGEVALALRDYTGAVSLSEQALKISREIGEEWSISICLNNLADAYCKNGQVEKALEQITEAIQIAWKNEASRFLARFVVTAGRCYQLLGSPLMAQELFTAALAHTSTEHDIREKAMDYQKEIGVDELPAPDDGKLGDVVRRLFHFDNA